MIITVENGQIMLVLVIYELWHDGSTNRIYKILQVH